MSNTELQNRINAFNLITKNAPADLMTVDLAELSRLNAERRAAADKAEAAKNPPEYNFRQELDELDRRLANQMTVEEAKIYSDNQASLHKDAVKAVENEIKQLTELLKTPGLSRCVPLREGRPPVNGDSCDVCLFNRKLEAVQFKLQRTKENQQKSIRICGGSIAAAKELEAYRPRWEELKKRARTIDNARQHIRNHKDAPFQHEGAVGRNEVNFASENLRSRHLRFDK
jgi:hypothetical protein